MKRDGSSSYVKWLSWTIFLAAAGITLVTNSPVRAEPRETTPIWRAQIEMWVGDVEDAGTDDTISVQLNDRNTTRLDYGRDDLERKSKFTYDLMLDDVRTLRDITLLKLSKDGSDGLCLKSAALLINGRRIFVESFATNGKKCRWFDNEGADHRATIVSGELMRSSSEWRRFQLLFPPLLITRAELESRLEATMGHLHAAPGNKLYWGDLHGRAVEISRKDDVTVHADLDLSVDVNNLPDPEVDVDFDIRFSCADGSISVTTQNARVDVDSAWYHEVLSLGLIEIVDNKIEQAIEGALRQMPYSSQVNTGQPVCPRILVTDDGGLTFQLTS